MRRLSPPQGPQVTLELDGEVIHAHEGEMLATALLASGERVFSRSSKYHRPRGPFCLGASCTHCLMRVDGVPNVMTCRVPVRAGMRVERQNAYPTAKNDLLGTIDFLFPRGLHHHEMFAGVPIAEQVMLKVAYHLAGLGVIPDQAVERMPCETIRTQVAIAGGGAAGSAAAEVLADKGVDFVLFERDPVLGGSLVYGAPQAGDPAVPSRQWRPGSIRLRAVVIGLFDDADGQYLAVTQYGPEGPRLVKAYAEHFLLTTGGFPPIVPFENNDLPGVFAGRAATLLLRRDNLLVGDRVAVVGDGPDLYATAALLEEKGAKLAAVLETREAPPAAWMGRAVKGTPLKAHGRTRVTALTFQPAGGRSKKVECEAVVLAASLSPAFELARQGGANVVYSEEEQTFVVEADEDGRTRAGNVRVAGGAVRPMPAAQAVSSGRRAAAALVGGAS